MLLSNNLCEKLPDWLAGSPLVREVLDRHAREVQAERKAAADELAALARDLDDATKAHTKLAAPLETKADNLRQALQAAELLVLERRQAHDGVVHGLEARRKRLEWKLTASAPAAIDVAIERLGATFDARRSGLYRSALEPTGRVNLKSGKPTTRVLSNISAVERLADQIVDARRALEGLKRAALDGAELDAAIAEIVGQVQWNIESELEPVM